MARGGSWAGLCFHGNGHEKGGRLSWSGLYVRIQTMGIGMTSDRPRFVESSVNVSLTRNPFDGYSDKLHSSVPFEHSIYFDVALIIIIIITDTVQICLKLTNKAVL